MANKVICHTFNTKPALFYLYAKRAIMARPVETIVDYLNHFSRKLFAQITSAAMTVTDERAAGTTQHRFTSLSFLPLLPSLLVLFFLILGLFCL